MLEAERFKVRESAAGLKSIYAGSCSECLKEVLPRQMDDIANDI